MLDLINIEYYSKMLNEVAEILEKYNKRKKSEKITEYVAELRGLAAILDGSATVEEKSISLFKKLYQYIRRII